MNSAFDTTACDLCGSSDSRVLLQSPRPVSLRSDRTILETALAKLECLCCGLVRAGRAPEGQEASAVYRDSYEHHGIGDHVFHTRHGDVPRSRVFEEWLVDSMGAFRWRAARRCLEVGSGEGQLLERMQARFPAARFTGLELSEAAAHRARQRSLDVRDGALTQVLGESFDIVWSIAVLEHVPSPTCFLRELRRSLVPNGLLYLSQPTQDVESYDLFFEDHLHHFTSKHIRGYAEKTGFQELGLVVGHEVMPNFSLHALRVVDEDDGVWKWHGPPSETCCGRSAARTLAAFERLDRTLELLRRQGRRVAVLGLGEVFWLAKAYATLGDFPFVFGLDDRPGRAGLPDVPFPIVRPEAALSEGVTDIVIATNAVFYDQLEDRLGGSAELHFVLDHGAGAELSQ